MTSEYPATISPATTTSAAFEALDELMARYGVDGLVAAAQAPGLLSAVDQHAAAVRDMLLSAGRNVDAEALAGYARSIEAAAARMGRALPDAATLDWSRASWFVVRLLAVCSLAVELV